jgi:hypothetical protein
MVQHLHKEEEREPENTLMGQFTLEKLEKAKDMGMEQ